MDVIYWFLKWIIVFGVFVAAYYLFKGGTVKNEKQYQHEEEPKVIIVRFDPLEVNVTVNVTTPEPQVRGLLTLGPVSEKKDKVI
jgi:hypothetical protein